MILIKDIENVYVVIMYKDKINNVNKINNINKIDIIINKIDIINKINKIDKIIIYKLLIIVN